MLDPPEPPRSTSRSWGRPATSWSSAAPTASPTRRRAARPARVALEPLPPDQRDLPAQRGRRRAVLVSGPTRPAGRGHAHGWELTGGRFDPTVGQALERARLRPLVAAAVAADPAAAAPGPSVGCGGVSIDLDQGLVQLPRGTHPRPRRPRQGPGRRHRRHRADGRRRRRRAGQRRRRPAGHRHRPDGDDWLIAVEHPDHPDDPGHHLTHLALTGGGVATSTAARRHWSTRDGTPVHHLDRPGDLAAGHHHPPAGHRRRRVRLVGRGPGQGRLPRRRRSPTCRPAR